MPDYELNRLGETQFEHLVQALAKKFIAPGTTTFGAGPDGGREATYSGRSTFPSTADPWDGNWIIQAKFHDTKLVRPDQARRLIVRDLNSELEKITGKYQRDCDNYILATNVALSSVPDIGTHDQIQTQVIPNFSTVIRHIQVWGYDDIARMLDLSPEIRRTYYHLLTPGDVLAELLDAQNRSRSFMAETVQLYIQGSFDHDQYAQPSR